MRWARSKSGEHRLPPFNSLKLTTLLKRMGATTSLCIAGASVVLSHWLCQKVHMWEHRKQYIHDSATSCLYIPLSARYVPWRRFRSAASSKAGHSAFHSASLGYISVLCALSRGTSLQRGNHIRSFGNVSRRA